MKLSLIVIARDEREDLPACLRSVRGLADEIVVVDGGSTDETVRIAESAGARVSRRAFDGFGPQKQHALEQARGEWVLNLDADERLSSALAGEIRRELASPRFDGYRLPFEVEFMGRRMRHGGLGGESHLRLFRRAASRFPRESVHEGVELNGAVGRLRAAVLHRPYRDVSEYLEKLDIYTDLAARRGAAEGRRLRPWHHLLLPLEFLKRYVLQLGVLDGTPGLVWCVLSAFHAWLKRVKLAAPSPGPRGEAAP